MPHVSPVPRETLEEFEPAFVAFEERAGFLLNSLLTMAHRPGLLKGFQALSAGAMQDGTLDTGLKRLVALVASTAAGCRYCQAHSATFAVEDGVDAEKVASVFEFERNDQFSAADRAALRLARDAAQVPNAVTGAHFDELREHFDDGEIVELVGVIAMFGFLNRWNDTMATQLEHRPFAFGLKHLYGQGWAPGKHVTDEAVDS